jgi:type I restriction enzyme, S subunit
VIEGLRPYADMVATGIDWMPELPAHWRSVLLCQIGQFLKGYGGSKEDVTETGVQCIRYGDLYTTHTFHIRRAKSFISAERAESYAIARYGDVLFAASGETIAEIGKSAVNLIEDSVRCGGEVIIFRATIAADAAFLGYATDCHPAAAQKASMGRGVTVKHIYGAQLKRLRIALPPLEEQRLIVRFLDWHGGMTARLIRAKKRLIALLNEQKQSIIHRAVTRGLDPTAPLKPSGVDWLGDVPEGWEVAHLRYLTTCLDGRRIPLNASERGKMLGEFPYWGANKVIDHVDQWLFDEPLVLLGEDGAPFFEPGRDVAFAVDGKIWVNNHAHVLRCGKRVEPAFLALALNCVEYVHYIDGSTRDKLTQQSMGSISIQVPPLDEQRAIVSASKTSTASIELAVADAQREITLIQEFRTRLIADVVTGQLDVRAFAATLPAVTAALPGEPDDDTFDEDADALEDEEADA